MSLTKKEEKILQSIVIPSEGDPNRPEFPPDNPHWPSTPIIKIKVKGFDNVFVKDESVNPTGTHKDRMAWEMVVTYKKLLESKKEGRIDKLPQLSIISSGSAANAIQKMLNKYDLPHLKILIDYRIDEDTKKYLSDLGCEIYEVDLSKRILSAEEILSLTDNEDGIDITSDISLGPFDTFYDWMSYGILNQGSSYVFVPYGTGNLYENIINIAIKETKNVFFHDKRLKINPRLIRKCNFIGATTNNPNSKADKLYSPHLPFVHFDTKWIKLSIQKGYIGPKSGVSIVRESYLDDAMKIAKEDNIDCEYSGIAGLALMLQMKDSLKKNDKILIVNTGKTILK